MSTSPTIGVRTWRRTAAAGASAPLAERIAETTAPADMQAAIAAAAFVTIPRQTPDSDGYDDAYAAAFAAALAARFGYAGGRRVSTSGRSHVFEREAAPVAGAAVDLGLPPLVTTAPPQGDGLGYGLPSVHVA